jgi:iron complex outermembrane recepter protein
MRHNGRFVGASLLVFAFALPVHGSAQAQGASDNSGLEEIVVTAQRRAQNLQNVPLAVQAVTAAALERSGVSNIDRLAQAVTGLTIFPQLGTAQPYIRGVGTFVSGTGEEGSVATYVDGVYYGQLSANVFALNNVERVEVLKGPQGTLFGRNATGGLLQVITRDPSHEAFAELTGGYGSFETVTGSLYATAGLSEAVASDVALYYNDQNKGWGRNLSLPGRPYVHRRKNFAARTKTKVDAGDAMRITLAADYVYARAPGTASVNGFPGRRLFDGQGQVGSVYDSRENIPETASNKQYGASARIEYDIADAVTLTSTTAYRHYKSFVLFDQDHTAIPFINIPISDLTKTFQQEFLLTGKTGLLDFTAGIFAYDANAGKDNSVVIQSAVVPTLNSAISARIFTRSYAGFAQGDFHLTDQLTASLGLRYTHEIRTLKGNIVGIAPNPLAGITLVDTANLPRSQTHRKFNKLTWRGALQYQVGPDAMIYASASRGFKSGVFSSSALTDPATEPETLDAYALGLKSDWLDGQLRLNIEGFYYKYKNIQLTQVVLGGNRLTNAAAAEIKGIDVDVAYAPPLSVGKLYINAGGSYSDAAYEAFKAAPCYAPNPAPLPGNSTFSCDASGNNMVMAPKFTANASIDYRFPISALGDLGFNLGWSHNSGFHYDPQNLLKQKAYDVVNLQVMFEPEAKNWQIKLFSTNIFDKIYYTSMFTNAAGDFRLPAEPRVIGVSFTYRLGKRG